jgi:hypothetical protein
MELVEMYLQCHETSTDGINHLGQLVLAVSQTSSKTALAGAALSAGSTSVSGAGGVGPSDHGQSRIFNVPVPRASVGKGEK